MYDLVVIGAGPGGYEAAAHAGTLGKKVALIEKSRLGGTCLNSGCIPTKTFLHAAGVLHNLRRASETGISVEGTGAIDMPALQAGKNSIVEMLRRGVAGKMRKSKVTTIEGAARIVSRDTVEVNGERVPARNILIATGSVPATPPIPGIDSPAVIDSTAALECTSVPESLVVIGGGVIGCEMACFFAEAGSSVAIIEMLPALAAMLDSDVSSALEKSLRDRGVAVHTSCTVRSCDTGTVSFTDAGGTPRSISAEYILNATGRRPATQGLGLEEAGIDVARRRIRVNDRGRTNIPGIWACGDVTGRCMLAHAATREGIVAVNAMFGGRDTMRFGAVPWVVYTHPEAAGVGTTEQSLRDDGVEYRAATVPMAVAGRYVIESGNDGGMVKVLAGKKYGEILGVHAVGTGCSEFIFGAAAMIETQARVDDIREIVFPHPTISEALKEAVVHLAGYEKCHEHLS